jgi:uncharacterized protein with ATP-grasp and redox domains
MRLKPDCIPGILTTSIGAIRKLGLVDAMVRAFFTDILTIPGLGGLEWSQTNPDTIAVKMRRICEAVDNDDPFQAEKIDLNRRVLKIYPFLKNVVERTKGSHLN